MNGSLRDIQKCIKFECISIVFSILTEISVGHEVYRTDFQHDNLHVTCSLNMQMRELPK